MQEGKRYWAVYAASRAQAVWCAQQMSDAPRAMQLPEYQDQIEIGALLVVRHLHILKFFIVPDDAFTWCYFSLPEICILPD